MYKNGISTNSTNKNRNIVTNTSKRKTSHKKILNNLFYNFQEEKQKNAKYYSKIETGIKRRLTEKKIRKEEKGQRFMKNFEIYKNRKLNLNINYINSSNNYNTKVAKGGIKYLNSVGNNGVLENSNIKSIEANKKNYNKITIKKNKNKN